MSIDLNCDLGEGFGRWALVDDRALLAEVTSANVACGFHAGDALTMTRTVRSAIEHGSTIGAHVGYRDLAGFGRRALSMEPDELIAETIYQIGALDAVARSLGSRVRYVKAHGALYNRAMVAPLEADAIADAVLCLDPALPVVGMPGSVLERSCAERGIRFVSEVFIDRTYQPDGTLTPRSREGAVITDGAAVADRALRAATDGVVLCLDGRELAVTADTLCIHGDSPDSVSTATIVRAALAREGVDVRAFVSG